MNRIKIGYEVDEALEKAADAYADEAAAHYRTLRERALAYTGWVDYAAREARGLMDEVRALAGEIRDKSEVFVVVGIGGSYLGAHAALDYIGGGLSPGDTEVRFAGFNLSGAYHKALLEALSDRDFSIVQISKSGGTVEPGMAYRALRELLARKYGQDGADARTYAVTDAEHGALREEARARGYHSLVIPSDVGGRFSVLTPVGLLPMAVGGVDIDRVIAGARDAAEDAETAKAIRLACVRKAIQDAGKVVEVIGCFDPPVDSFIQWLLQLYGESEGKDGKGMLPAGISLSRDLHSLGQFFQQGRQIFSETLISVAEPAGDVVVGADGGFFAGRGMNEFNGAVRAGMMRAHRDAGIPIITVEAPDMSAHSFGLLVYLFEVTCGVTGLLMGVDPFNQPGVEAYKKEMMAILRK